MREAGVNLVTRRHLRLGAARAAPRASTTSAGWTRSSTCCTRAASASTWPPRPRRRRRGFARAPGDAAGRPPTAPAVAGRPAGLLPELAGLPRAARWRSSSDGRRYGEHPAVVLWHVSQRATAATTRTATATCRAAAFRRLAAATGTATSTALNDAWGTAFWSQRYATGTRCCRRGSRRPSPTRPSSWTSAGSPPTSCWPTTRRARRAARPPRRPGDHQLHGHAHFKHDGLLRLGAARWTSSPTTTT